MSLQIKSHFDDLAFKGEDEKYFPLNKIKDNGKLPIQTLFLRSY